ncbi:MAG TPA: hypothetical protein VMF89_37105 [Polyangiales bacterium]|nr:hypothetical protein [Polyangiales bacterium]
MRRGDGELILFWLLPALGVTWIAACWMFPGFDPPMSPLMAADDVAAFYRDPDNATLTKISMVLFNWFCVGMIPFLALIVTQIHRMAHHTPIWGFAFIGCMAGGPTLLFTADLFWLVAAFRPERDAALTQMYNDIAWVTFSAQAGFLVAQCIFLAIAIYLDHQTKPVFKTWVAHFNLAIAAALVPATFSAVSLSGPIAWDGIASFWIKNGALITWLVVMTIVLGTTLYAQRHAEQAVVR